MQVNPTTFPIAWFRDRNIEKSLILKPPYQRKPVWTNTQRTFLIDTIIRKYHIPEVYIHRETDSGGHVIYNIVDGQQRIRTILEFIGGELSLSSEYTPEYADYSFEDLPSEIKEQVLNYTIYAREITNATDVDVRNLFKRMNKNVVTLNPQELRHATYSGDFIKLMEGIAEDGFWAENKIVTTTEIRRMNDVQFVSDLFISMMNGIQNKTKEMDNFYTKYEENFPDKEEWLQCFYSIKQNIIDLFPNLKDTRWKNKSDFYTLFMVISQILAENKFIPEDNCKKISSKLNKFAEEVSIFTKKENKTKRFEKDIVNYSNAVIKSTTDKDRRMIRHKIIYNLFSKYLKLKKSVKK